MKSKRPETTRSAPFSFQAFLSHRYKSPDINLYFFNLFSETSEVQFEVDEGVTATNVTRLERMIRSADAFIGIYPFPGSWEDAESMAELRKASRYFRLELDLAIRSRKPAIVFYDERYGDLLKPPQNIPSRTFKFLEVTGKGGYPHADRHRKAFGEFCEMVNTRRAYDLARTHDERTSVGVFVPSGKPAATGYSARHLRAIEETLDEGGWNNIRLFPWPPVLNRDSFQLLQEIEWAVVDIGDEMAATGIPSYLHGRFVPMIRMKKVPTGVVEETESRLEQFLFGAVEVGYKKDLFTWDNESSLRKGLRQRLLALKAGVRRINTRDEAETYFRSAALRKEAVFLSYSGKDQDVAAGISAALRRQFQKVFDYRDGRSISAGKPWLDEIFEQLATSAVGIPLLSESYFQSGNCKHEARQMVAQHDNGNLRLLPIKIFEGDLTLPSWLESIHYLRRWEHADAEALAHEVARLIEDSRTTKP